MDRNSVEWHEILLENFYNQIHLTVIYELDFIKRLGSYAALLDYRDTILDNINEKRRYLGRI
jgi:hypothetical protein